MDGINILLLVLVLQVAVAAVAFPIAKRGCEDECGGVKIPYPFGIGDGCFYNHTFHGSDGYSYNYGLFYNITCNKTTNPHTPIYGNSIQVLNISLDDHSFRRNTIVAYDCYQNSSSRGYTKKGYLNMVWFPVNTTRNKFVAIGCDTKATFQGYRFGNDYYYTGCNTYCTSISIPHIKNGTCSGVGCCETLIPDGTAGVNTSLSSYFNHIQSTFSPCSAAFVVEDAAFNFSTASLSYQEDHFINGDLYVPTVFDWSILNSTCNPTTGQDKVLCGLHTECIDGEDATLKKSYRCKCLSGYSGNPYLPQGCQDIDECSDPTLNDCQKSKYCVNTEGGYDCKCPSGHHGNGTNTDKCIAKGWNSLLLG